MMRTVGAIAVYTFREAVRNKILYSILFFCVALILLAVVLGAASVQQDARFVSDIGLMSINFFGDVIAMFLGITSVFQEIERKTIYNILSKPIDRAAYFVGKFLGIALTLAVQVAMMSLALVGVMLIRQDAVGASLAAALWLVYVESILLASFALFFGAFSTPYVSGFITLGVWLAGRLVEELAGYLDRVDDPLVRGLGSALVQVAPDLNLFTLSTQVTYGYGVPAAYVLSATGYGFAYMGLALAGGMLIFRRRDFI